MNGILVTLYSWGNYLLNIYHNIKSKIFFLSDIKDNHETNEKELFFKFYYLYYLNYASNLFPFFNNHVNSISQRHNRNHDLIKVKITNGKIHRNIIFKDTTLHNLVHNVKDMHHRQSDNIFNENEIILAKRFPVLDIYYKDANSNKISIKDIIKEYGDKSKHHENNSISNILKLEKINAHNNKIYVLLLKMIRREEKEINLNERDYHISDIYD